MSSDSGRLLWKTGIAILAIPLLLVSLPAPATGALVQPAAATCTPGATEVANDAEIQAAFASSTDDSVICVVSDITVSATLQLDDTNLRLESSYPGNLLRFISGANVRQILNVDYTGPDDDTLTIVGVQFSEGNSSADGGALRIEGENGGQDAVIVSRSIFSQSTAALSGGAISTVNVANVSIGDASQLLENTSTSGSGGGLSVLGSSGTVRIGVSSWQDDSAAQFGGAIYSTLPVEVQSAIFQDNLAQSQSGGAIYTTQALEVAGSYFVGNDASAGGAIYATASVQSTDDSFWDNRALAGSGGAIGGTATVELDGSDFEGNRALGAGSDGGAVAAGGQVTADGGNFIDNRATDDGGAIHSTAGVTVTDATFRSNLALGDGGALSGVNVATTGSTFVGNSTTGAGSRGGALSGGSAPGLTVIASSTFIENSTQGSGGAVGTTGATTVSESTFSGNSAPDPSGFGGAIYNPTAAVAVDQSAFLGNWAGGSGGALWAAAAAVIDRATFTDNFSASQGGAVWTQRLTASRVAFIGNGDDSLGAVRTLVGGAIFADDSGTLTNLTSTDNVADDSGGLLAGGSAGVDLQLRYVTSVDDSASSGQVIALVSAGSVSISGSALSSNGPLCFDVSDPTPDFSAASAGSYVTDASCGLADDSITLASDDSLGFITPITTDDTPGSQVIVPTPTSILVNRVPSTLIAGVTTDQIGVSRAVPAGLTTVGAVQVLPQPTFTTSPQGQTIAGGASATFTAVAAGGTGALTLQWQRSADGGASWSAVSGAQASSYSTGAVSASDSGTRYRVAATDVNLQVATSGSALLTVASPSPGPSPGTPPSAPLSPLAVAGDAHARVTWAAPLSPGSFPVTAYEVASDGGERSCLHVVEPGMELACTVDGLLNGTSYRFRVRAVSGAGWGEWSTWSEPVTPRGPSLLITGTRARDRIAVEGTTTGLVGETVTPRVKLAGQKVYSVGRVKPVVDDSGRFEWSRKTGKKAYVYFQSDGVRSNSVTIPARKESKR